MQWAYGQVGVELPRVSTQQAKAGREVSAADARPGDLVFFERGAVDHIGMYAGDGKWVVAPKTGDVVKLQDVDLTQGHQRSAGSLPGAGRAPAAAGRQPARRRTRRCSPRPARSTASPRRCSPPSPAPSRASTPAPAARPARRA